MTIEQQALALNEDWFEEVISDSLEMDWTPRDAARLIMSRLASTGTMEERPFAYCCAEAGGDPAICDCVRPNHGTAFFPALAKHGLRIEEMG